MGWKNLRAELDELFNEYTVREDELIAALETRGADLRKQKLDYYYAHAAEFHARARARMARIRQDPAVYAEYRARKNEHQRLYRARMKLRPGMYAAALAAQAEYERNRLTRLKENPEAYEEYRARKRAADAAYRARKKAEDLEGYLAQRRLNNKKTDADLARQRERSARYRAKKKADPALYAEHRARCNASDRASKARRQGQTVSVPLI